MKLMLSYPSVFYLSTMFCSALSNDVLSILISTCRHKEVLVKTTSHVTGAMRGSLINLHI